MYFAFLIDVFSRMIVGWQLASPHAHRPRARRAADGAGTRQPGADVQLVQHTDQGSQYTAEDYTQVLDDHRVLASVGTVGDAYDNALAESFVDSYKTELIADRVWRTNAQLELATVALRRLVQPPPAALLDREPAACRARTRVLGAARARVRTGSGSGRPNRH